MKITTKIAAGAVLAWFAAQAGAVDISGAGSSAAKPLYAAWGQAYAAATKDAVNYDPIGSSAGLKKMKEHGVDFGATDVALSREEGAKDNLICFPTSVSGVVPFVNIPGVKPGKLNLSGPVLAAIFMGKIKNWNDREIAALNAGRDLPNLPIRPVVRQDGSGTTYNFSDYLSRVSADWKTRFGTSLQIQWPGDALPAQGSDGVIKTVGATAGAIGYTDYSYILLQQLSYVKMQNRQGAFVEPSYAGFTAALSNSDWKTQARFEEMLNDKPGNESWPITAGTFVLLPKVTNTPEKTTAALKFFTWGFQHGDEIARKNGYVRLNDSLQARIFSDLTQITDAKGNKLQWGTLGN